MHGIERKSLGVIPRKPLSISNKILYKFLESSIYFSASQDINSSS